VTAVAERHVEYVPLDEVRLAARNPKRHDDDGISRSISHFGVAELPLLDERTGRLVAGHGRHEQLVAMRDGGKAAPEGVRVDEAGRWLMPVIRGWASRSDEDAEAYLIASNRLTTKGGWNDAVLAEVLQELDAVDMLDLTGYGSEDLGALLGDEADAVEVGDGTGDMERPEKGEALKLAGVTVGEPEIQAHTGQVWQVGRHHLVVADVHADWHRFLPLLEDGDLLWPYPSLLAPFASQAEERRVVMVQPNNYLAGWLLTKYKSVTGQTPVLVEGSS
jgi:hypothetical protein